MWPVTQQTSLPRYVIVLCSKSRVTNKFSKKDIKNIKENLKISSKFIRKNILKRYMKIVFSVKQSTKILCIKRVCNLTVF